MLSLFQIRRPLTEADALEYVSSFFNGLGFETTGWADGSIQKTFVRTLALVLADFSEVGAQLADFGFNDYAEGDVLDEYSWSRYRNRKRRATRTMGPMRLISVSSVPNTILPGQLTAATDEGTQFRNTTGGTLPAGSLAAPSAITIQWEARVAGASGNVADGTVTRLITPIAGVRVANDQGSPWYTTAGEDEEADEVTRQRNSTQWARLTVELIADSYRSIALEAGAKKVKIHDNNPRGPGTLDVYCAGEIARLGSEDMERIQLAFSTRALQTDSTWHEDWPLGNLSRVATRHTIQLPLDVDATVFFRSGSDPAVIEQRCRVALRDLLRRTPIGGWDYSPGPANILLREDVSDALKHVEGVHGVIINAPVTATVSMGPFSLLVEGNWSITVLPVGMGEPT